LDKEEMRTMNSTMKAGIGIIAVAAVAILFMHCGGIGPSPVPNVPTPGTGDTNATNPVGTGTGQTETISLSYDGFQYSPAEIRVKQGTNVRIEGDPATLRGCMLVVNIGGYNVSKAIRSGDNVIEFTADKVGTFPIYCNMGIGDGKLIVESG
jgi:plastocyanin